MQKSSSIFAVSMACVSFFFSSSACASYRTDTLKAYADESETVAKVTIIGKESLFAKEKGGRRLCGYKYRAEVSESFKGKAGEIVFYDDDISYSVDGRYLVFIRRHEKSNKVSCKKSNDKIAGELTSYDLCNMINSGVDWACEKIRVGLSQSVWTATSEFLEGEHDGTEWVAAPMGVRRDQGVRVVSYEKKVKENCYITERCFMDLQNLEITEEKEGSIFDRLIAWKDYRQKIIDVVGAK